MNDCNRYWLHADYLPIDVVISYWCELSGFNTSHCRDAKQAAILSAVEKNLIKFRRSDGKTFKDDVFELVARGLLQIERNSFNVWAEQFSDGPIIDKPLGNRERETLLTIIAALCKEANLDHTKHAKTAGLIQGTAASMGLSIGETTIEGHLKKISMVLKAA